MAPSKIPSKIPSNITIQDTPQDNTQVTPQVSLLSIQHKLVPKQIFNILLVERYES